MSPRTKPGIRQRKSSPRASAAVLPVKLTPPLLTRVFPRERLYRQLDAALERGHAWIEGPPGAGKTTLAASYARERGLRCLWYRIDGGDTDVATFFHFLRMAAAHLLRRQRRTLPPFTPEYVSNPAGFGRIFFEELRAAVKAPLTLVFDNYQDTAPDTALHDVLCESFLHVRGGIRAVMISRGSAPPAFARLSVYVPVTSLRAEDLELTTEEALGIATLRRARTSTTSRARVEELRTQARGWLAGLILLLEGDHGHRAAAEPLATTSRQAVFNYFAREIYERREARTQDILPRLAILPEMTPWLAQNLTHSPRAGELLQSLQRRNYFVSYQAQSDSYHFHPLFRDFLLERLQERLSAAELTALRCHAARLLEEQGFIEAAIGLYREASQWESLVRLVLSLAPGLARQSRFATIAGWLENLPDEVVAAVPWVLYWRGLCKATLAPLEARRTLEAAFAAFEKSGDPAGLYLSWAGIIETIQIEWSDFHPVDKWIPVFEKLRERYPEFPSREVEIPVVGAVVCALAVRNLHHPTLPEWLARAEALIAADADTPPWWSTQLAWYYLWTGQPDRVRALVQRVRRISAESETSPLFGLLSRVTVAMYDWCLGDPASAGREVQAGLQFSEQHDLLGLCTQLLGQGVYASLVRGAPGEARGYLQKMATLVGRRGRIEVALFHHLASMIAVHEGDFTAAETHARTAFEMAEAGGQRFATACCLYMHANIALLKEDRDQTQEYLAALRVIAEETASRPVIYWHCLASAMAKIRFEGHAAGLPLLAEALALSRQLGGQSLPWLPHSVLAEVYAVALEHDIQAAHVRSLIERMGVAPTAEQYGLDAWPFPVKVRTLGAFTVQVNGSPLKFSTKAQKRPLELLKALIALGGKNVSESRIAESLWPELNADGALRSLASTLYRLRKLIGERCVERQQGRLTLSPRYCWTDLWATQRLLTQLDAANAERQTDRIASLVHSLLRLYRGAFLETEGDPSWAIGLRERIRRMLVGSLETAGGHLFEAARSEAAIACYQRALEVDPLAESIYRRLIESYLALDRRAEALVTFRRCRQLFEAELGVAPSSRTCELVRQIKES